MVAGYHPRFEIKSTFDHQISNLNGGGLFKYDEDK